MHFSSRSAAGDQGSLHHEERRTSSRNSPGFGWIRALESELLTWPTSRCRALEITFLNRARSRYRSGGTARGLDSLTVWRSVRFRRRFKELVYAMTSTSGAMGRQLQMNMEIAELLAQRRSPIRRLFAADNVDSVKYVEVNGGLDRDFRLEGPWVRHTPKSRDDLERTGSRSDRASRVGRDVEDCRCVFPRSVTSRAAVTHRLTRQAGAPARVTYGVSSSSWERLLQDLRARGKAKPVADGSRGRSPPSARAHVVVERHLRVAQSGSGSPAPATSTNGRRRAHAASPGQQSGASGTHSTACPSSSSPCDHARRSTVGFHHQRESGARWVCSS